MRSRKEDYYRRLRKGIRKGDKEKRIRKGNQKEDQERKSKKDYKVLRYVLFLTLIAWF